MRNPARGIVDNLVWTFDGTVAAVYRIDGPTYRRLGTRDKLNWHAGVTAAVAGLPGESMILGISRRIDAADVRLGGAGWAAVARERLGKVAHYERETWLVAFLPQTGKAGLAASSAMARVGQKFRLPPMPVTKREAEVAERQAEEVQRQLARLLGARRVLPASPADLLWLYGRAALRGHGSEPRREQFQDPVFRWVGEDNPVLRGPALAGIRPPKMYEGGTSDDKDRPHHRHYLRLDPEHGASYQSVVALTQIPRKWSFPDGRGECLTVVDQCDFPVDWCLRIKPTSNAAAQGAIKGQIRTLTEQFSEYQGDTAGPPPSLAQAIADMEAEWESLAGSPGAPECQTTFLFALGAEDLLTLEARVKTLRSMLGADEHIAHRFTGDQCELWGAMLPASSVPPVCNDAVQYLLPPGVAGCAPFTGNALGDGEGAPLGSNLEVAGGALVQWSPGRGPATNRSGSIAILGKTGSGKSHTLKTLVYWNVHMGGKVLAIDRTTHGEWGQLGPHLPGTHQTVNLGLGSDICADPLRVFSGEPAISTEIGFLTLLTATDPTSVAGTSLSRVVRMVAEGPRPSSRKVVDALLRVAHEPTREIGEKLMAYCEGGFASVVFGDGPRVELGADCLTFHLPGLDLPDEEELRSEQRSRYLLPEQVFSMALLYLVTAVGRHVAFADTSRFSAIVMDEAWVLASSPQGRRLLMEMVREGRRHNAGLWTATQDPRDNVDERLLALMGSLFCFRLDASAASKALALLGMDATDGNLSLLSEQSRDEGQCLYRDLDKRVGLLQVWLPPDASYVAAMETNPTVPAHLNGHSLRKVTV